MLTTPLPPGFPLYRPKEGGPAIVRMMPLETLLPGLLAVMSTRWGGLSRPPWDTLNLGYHVGDSPVDVTENRRRLFEALHLDPDTLVTGEQVHGSTVRDVAVAGAYAETDGLVTMTRGLLLAVFCADCVPLFLLDPRTPAAGLVHAGWKGTVAAIGRRAVEMMARRFGGRPAEIHAVIGPSIGPCCYEVGRDVAGEAEDRFGPTAVRKDGDRRYFDLWEANRLTLLSAGLDNRSIHVSAICTSCRADLFYSHRRETVASRRQAAPEASAPRAGRMAGLLRLPVLPGKETYVRRKN